MIPNLPPYDYQMTSDELALIGLSVCANPKCAVKYFHKLRHDQRFCKLAECLNYGQREHKRKWWHAHKHEQRPSKHA